MRPVGAEFAIRFKLREGARVFDLALGDILVKTWHHGPERGSFSLYRIIDIVPKVKIAHCRAIVIAVADCEVDEKYWELTD